MGRDFIVDIGPTSLGSRLKRLSDRLMQAASLIYTARGVAFEPRWYPTFRFLLAQGPASIGDIAQALGVSHAAISQVAQSLRKAGVITAAKDQQDERRSLLTLTEAGMALADELRPIWADIAVAVDGLLAGVDPAFFLGLNRIEQALDERALHERVADARKRRIEQELTVVPFRPELAGEFKRLNLPWLSQFDLAPHLATLDDPQAAIVAPGGQILFAMVGAEVVGTCALIRDGERMELAKMGVAEAYKGYGVGARLMEAALATARECGAKAVYLYTNSRLQPALGLYRKFGFQEGRSERVRYAQCDVYLERPLVGAPTREVRVVPFEGRWAQAFKQLNLTWIEAYFHVEPADRAVLNDPQGAIIAPGGHILMALSGETAVGTCALIRDGDRFELAKMAVDPHYQGHGIGAALLQAALDTARAEGARGVYLVTNSRLKAAVALYRKFGFVEASDIALDHYTRTDLAMSLALPVKAGRKRAVAKA